jgi:hypothetical protein
VKNLLLLAFLGSLVACNAITGVDDLSFEGAASSGGAGGSGGASAGGQAGQAGQAGAGPTCEQTTPAATCHKCCDAGFPAGKTTFEHRATEKCPCSKGCEQDCQVGGCDGEKLSAPSCRACIASACPSPCPEGDAACEGYASCLVGCGPSLVDHGPCAKSGTLLQCRTCCQSAHPRGYERLATSMGVQVCACGSPTCASDCAQTCSTGTISLLCAHCLSKAPCPGLCPQNDADCDDYLSCLASCET